LTIALLSDRHDQRRDVRRHVPSREVLV